MKPDTRAILEHGRTWLRSHFDERGLEGALRTEALAEPIDVELRVFESLEVAPSHAVTVGVRLHDPGDALDGLRTTHVGVGADPSAAMAAALEAWSKLVLPPVVRMCGIQAANPDLEIAQVIPSPGAATELENMPRRRWSVWLGEPEIRAGEDQLPTLAAAVTAQGPFERLSAAGALPHFPGDARCHWLNLTVARHGERRLTRCEVDNTPWPAAIPALEAFAFPETSAASPPMHVRAFVLLRRRADS